jgi:uncharacterized protein YbjT (DUF2867 family)
MRVLLFGATGMVGQGVLRECLQDPGVTDVLTVGRTPIGAQHPKLRTLIHGDLLSYQTVEHEFLAYDACFFCLGASAAGRTEKEYAAINHLIPVAVGTVLARLKPGLTFVYVSGAGTDSTEHGRIMWARVKGRTENDLLRLPLNAFMFRPALIQPSHGEISKTPAYRIGIAAMKPVFPLLTGLFPGFASTTERIGRAMLHVARNGSARRILESRDINLVAREAAERA